jgi:hypothetical protein
MALSPQSIEIAKRVGVSKPDLIGVLVVDQMPAPDDPERRAIGERYGLLTPDTDGLTLAYAVFLRRGRDADARLLAHKFRHVQQYEAAHSVKEFLSAYISQLLDVGYHDAPLEVDARAHEHHGY